MQLNPLVKKDIKVQSRSMRISWGLFAYEAVMAVVFLVAMVMIKTESRWTYDNIYSMIVKLYPILAVAQFLIIGLVVPVRTASSISGEKERQTFDIMMTTSMTPFSIIWGKVLTAIIQSMFYVAAAMPVLAMVFVIGGLSISYLFWFLGIALLASLFAASIGIFCSSVCKKTVSAVVMSYIFYLGFFILTIAPYWIELMASNLQQSRGSLFTHSFLLFNPALYLIEFFTWVMGGDSGVYNMLYDLHGNKLTLTDGQVHYIWMAASTAALALVSFLFLWLASKRITPVSKKAVKKLAVKNRAHAVMPQEKHNG